MPFPYSLTVIVPAAGPRNAPQDPAGLWAAVHTALRLDEVAERTLSEQVLRFYPRLETRSAFGRYDPMSLVSTCTLRIQPVPIGLEVTLHVELVPLLVIALGSAGAMVFLRQLSPVNGVALALALLGIGYALVRWRMTRWLLALTQRSDDPAAT